MVKVTVLPANVSFDCDDNATILDEALRNGFGLPYGCRKGNCGTCKGQILEGEADIEGESCYALSTFERAQGFTLLCSAYAVTDLVVEMEGLDASDVCALPVTEHESVVRSVVPLTRDLWHLTLDLDGSLAFRAGQFAQLRVPQTEVWRSYSMANAPSQAERLEFVIKSIPGGVFSSFLESAKAGVRLDVRAPQGSCWVREGRRPLLFIGGGAGLAPLWSMVRDLAEHGDPRPARFFYGVRTCEDVIWEDAFREMTRTHRDFEYTVALSGGDGAADSTYARGMITDVVAGALGRSIEGYDAYLCGPPIMIDAALDLLHGFGLKEHTSIFFDKFTAS